VIAAPLGPAAAAGCGSMPAAIAAGAERAALRVAETGMIDRADL
jgi:hypothetical protein